MGKSKTMTSKDKRKVMAVKLRANNDNNGNPRRGWLIYTRDGEFLGFIDEGYSGRQAMTSLFPNAVELASIPVAASVYNDAKRNDQILGGY